MVDSVVAYFVTLDLKLPKPYLALLHYLGSLRHYSFGSCPWQFQVETFVSPFGFALTAVEKEKE